jgi:uncharacterized protein
MVDRQQVEEFLEGETWAVVGASDDRNKFGNITFRALKQHGKRVFPVNNKAVQVEGETAYASLSDLPEQVDRVLIVVPPKQGEAVVQEADKAGIDSVWFQPGAESVAALAYCEAHGMVAIAGRCILVTLDQ